MIITTSKFTKKFGDICFIYIIFVLNILDYLSKILLEKFHHQNYKKYFLFIILMNSFITFLCVYILVGSRIIFIRFYYGKYNCFKEVFSSKNITEFIPLKRNKKKLLFLMENAEIKKNNASNSFEGEETINSVSVPFN